VAGAGEADAGAVGEESAALGHGQMRRTTQRGAGSIGGRWLPFKGDGGGQQREGVR
jgi:hypothetical protein